jgi:hypothetical protein
VEGESDLRPSTAVASIEESEIKAQENAAKKVIQPERPKGVAVVH